MVRCVCIHGHFYQPPRENPWLEEVEFEHSSYPYHDWNDRITAECYEPNTASRIMAHDHRIIAIVNNYSNISFNFGPTLLNWLWRHNPSTYAAILEADSLSAKKFSGHGSALSQVYNHLIMPLANTRDKKTQVVWGISDFQCRFKRQPEGMWLPETAVNTETLETLSEHGIKFTILAPHQAARYKRIGDEQWVEAKGSIDPKKVYLCRLPSGRSISIFFYDGHIAKDVAFSNLLCSGEAFAKRLVSAFTEEQNAQLVSIATDGESYGHHHKYGDMALAYCLHYMEAQNLARLTNYAEFLEKYPPKDEVQIVENSSWSCAHGVERWKSDCGCNSVKGFHQKWRAPLRAAMDWLREAMAEVFEREGSRYFKDPWGVRDKYIEVILNRSRENVDRFLTEVSVLSLNEEDKIQALKLLEMQRHSMLMYTSCGWFFDEVSGIEGVQIMKYASRAIQLAKDFGVDLEGGFLERLKGAPSNIADVGDGATAYMRFVKPGSLDLLRVASHYTISSLFNGSRDGDSKIFCYTVKDEAYETIRSGKIMLVVGSSLISSDITLEKDRISFAVLWLGDHNIYGGARVFWGNEAFALMQKELFEGMKEMEIHRTIFTINNNFKKTGRLFSLRDLFRDRQAEIIGKILEGSVEKANFLMKMIKEDNHPALLYLKDMGIPAPHAIEIATDSFLNTELLSQLRFEPLDLKALEAIVNEIKLFGIEVQKDLVSLEASARIRREFEELGADPLNTDKMAQVERLLQILLLLQMEMNLWRAQNITFNLMSNSYAYMMELKGKGDSKAATWVSAFSKLCNILGVNIGP